MSHFFRFTLFSVGHRSGWAEVCIRNPIAMLRHILLPILLSVSFQPRAHAQAVDATRTTETTGASGLKQGASLREALRQVATGNGRHKGRLLAHWAGRQAGRCLHISVR
jgi:hypothetical protein